mmetsp:Transcript_1883/g.2155  ORF Transcript_1883/g.2155 Transcript_1883/m.2155 type:complete len:173 (-) Transcript_1883:355-873(-)
MDTSLDNFGLQESLALGVTIALGTILFLSYFPGNPESNAFFLDEQYKPTKEKQKEESDSATKEGKSKEEQEAEKLAKIWKEKEKKRQDEQFQERQKNLKKAGMDTKKLDEILTEGSHQPKDSRVPVTVLIAILKFIVYGSMISCALLFLSAAGMDFSKIFAKEIEMIWGKEA